MLKDEARHTVITEFDNNVAHSNKKVGMENIFTSFLQDERTIMVSTIIVETTTTITRN